MNNPHHWLCQPLDHDVARALERLARCEDVAHIAVMPDVHLANDICIGTVLATTTRVYPNAVGGDIGCGMSAVAFDCDADVLQPTNTALELLHALRTIVPVNRHHNPANLPAHLNDQKLSHPSLKTRKPVAAAQLGTLGTGNHFVEFQRDEESRLWLMIHTGSRGIGPAIRDHHLASATGKPIAALDAQTDQGRAYLADMNWAVDYARANRRAIADQIQRHLQAMLRIDMIDSTRIDCPHNFLRLEQHGGRSLYVHRKGANSAAVDEPGIIPGSMGTCSFHVTGRGCAESLCSSAHGAGRKFSRDAARRRITPNDLRKSMKGIWFDDPKAANLRDESPAAYKDIHKVMRAQSDLIRITRKLSPVLVYKGT